MDWSPQQATALKAVDRWIRDPRGQQVFRLFGYAGTGKTTLARHLTANVRGQVMNMCFTGKAALVLRSKGVHNASTIHSAIYKPTEDEHGKPVFVLNDDSNVRTAALVVVDEVSMVGPELGQDLLSFGTKVLVLGDPFQLPPVKGEGFFTAATPDVMLTEIHRQAADNPIIRLSMDVRAGKRLQIGQYDGSRVMPRSAVTQTQVMNADQVIVGMNRTRRSFNQRLRVLHGLPPTDSLTGLPDWQPVNGDRLICLRNNKDKGLLNGSLWRVDGVRIDGDVMTGKVIADDPFMGHQEVEVAVPLAFFKGEEGELNWWYRKNHDEFDYGYAITCHKAQGSQYDKVVLFDESGVFREDAPRWLYTGLTRAAVDVDIVV